MKMKIMRNKHKKQHYPHQTSYSTYLPILGIFSNATYVQTSRVKSTSLQDQEVIAQLEKLYFALINNSAYDENQEDNLSHTTALKEFCAWLNTISPTVKESIIQLAPDLGEQIKYLTIPNYWSLAVPSVHFIIRGLEKCLSNRYTYEQLSQFSYPSISNHAFNYKYM